LAWVTLIRNLLTTAQPGYVRHPIYLWLIVAGVVGVHGDSADAPQGSGVHGSSGQGIGVWGSSTGLFGVFGQAQVTEPSDPYSAEFTNPTNLAPGENVATGVFGIGDRYGGAFQVTPPQLDPALENLSQQFANVQLTPIILPDNDQGNTATPNIPNQPQAELVAPMLPPNGNMGDIIVQTKASTLPASPKTLR